MEGILGRKLGMTQIFTADGATVQVTVVQAGPCVVVARRTSEKDGYEAVQLGLVEAKPPRRVTKAQQGHFKKADVTPVRKTAEFGISAQEINDLSEIVAVDLVTTMTMRFIDMAINSRSDFNGADADSLREWREGLYETRRNFLGIAARTSQRFDQTFALIQRTQMLEKTLRTQLSPQMSAALRFSPGQVMLSGQF